MSKLTKERLLTLFSGIDDEYIVEAEYTEEERARLTVAARAATAIAKEAEETSQQQTSTRNTDEEDKIIDEELQTKPEALPKNTAAKIIRITFGAMLAAAALLALVLLWNPDWSDVASTTSSAEQEATTPEDTTTEDFIDEKDLAEVPIDSEHFPDALFKEFISARYDSNKDGILDPAEILAVKEIRLYKADGSAMEIEDLSGVEYFPALKVLECPIYELTRLDVSKNTFLRELNCSSSQLTELDVSKNTALRKLNCGSTYISELDLSYAPALEELDVSYDPMNAIDLSHNPALRHLTVSYTPMLELDITQNAALEELFVMGIQSTQIDISRNTALKNIVATASKLERLDISNNQALESVVVNTTTTVTGANGRESIIERIKIPNPQR
ncbi:MAG: hypothetical protein IKX10_00350 [Lachnospiraceae bacterium]|nr:hypothetical protein [Lachnospiraceae bacterium]